MELQSLKTIRMPPARGASKYQEGEPVLCFQGGLIYEAKVQALLKEDGTTRYRIHYKGWNKTWDESVPEERLLKMTPTNLQKQKEIQLAAKQKKVELDAAKTKKAEVEAKQRKIDAENCSKVRKSDSGPVKTKKTEPDGQKQIKPEVCVLRSGTPPVGVKRPSSSSLVGGGKSAGSYSKRGTKRGLGEGECTIKEVRLNVQRLKKLKSRSTSESSSASGQSSEDLSTRVKRRPQRAAALVFKVKLEDDDVNEGVSEKSFKRKKPISKARASTPDVPMRRQEPEESNDMRGPAFGSEIELPLPESLKNLLVDDFDLISRQRKTLMLPANINVADFLQSFSEEGEESEKVNVDEVCRGLCSYFDSTLGTQLLYKFERVQYSDIMKEHPGVPMSKLYPPIHLLRLLTKLPNLLACSKLEPQALGSLMSTLALLVEFMDETKETLFKKDDYGTASPEYHRRAL